MNYKDVYRRIITDPNAKIGFGKYKDSTIRQIILDDPEYLLWCESKGLFEMDHIIHDELEDMNPWVKGETVSGRNLYSAEAFE